MNNWYKIYKRLYSFSVYNLLLYTNFLLLFGLAAKIPFKIIISIALKLLPAYLLVGISGYFLNDLFDKKADAISNKFNITNIINKYALVFIIILFGLLGFYLLFTISKKANLVLIFQFLLLLGYSLPYIRLKEKGIFGLLTDALYAHVIPGIILVYVLQEYCVIPYTLWGSFLVFLFLLGLRDITIHQLEDIEKDRQSNIKTYAIKHQKNIHNQINIMSVLAAIALCVLLFFIQSVFNSLSYLLLFISLTTSHIIYFLVNKSMIKADLMVNYIVLSSALFLYRLIESQNHIGIILLLHPYFLQKTKSLLNYIFISLLPLIMNYTLYFIFLPFGRNLKEKPFYKKN